MRRVHVVDLDAAFGEPPQRALLASWRIKWRALAPRAPARRRSARPGGDRLGARRPASSGPSSARWSPAIPRASRALARELSRPAGARSRHRRRRGAHRRLATRAPERRSPTSAPLLRGLPCPAVLVTDVARDGMMTGPNFDLARAVARDTGLPGLLSGGVRRWPTWRRAPRPACREIAGAVVGRALYEGSFHAGRGADGGLWGGVVSGVALARTDLACRVIPCLDVAGGPRGQRRPLREPRRPGRPGRGGRAATPRRERTRSSSSTSPPRPRRRATDLDWVRRTAERVFIPLTVGGGVRSDEDARAPPRSPARTRSASTPPRSPIPSSCDRLARRFGSQCVVLSVDARRRPARRHRPAGRLSPRAAGRRPGVDALAWIREGVERGAGEILLTSIDRDGTSDGYDLDLLAAVASSGRRAGHRLRRRRHARAPGRRPRRRRRGGARGVDLPPGHLDGGRGEGAAGGGGVPDPAGALTPGPSPIALPAPGRGETRQ